MEEIKIVIETGNAAFGDGYLEDELARILKGLANRIENGGRPTSLMDINGNKVGIVVYYE